MSDRPSDDVLKDSLSQEVSLVEEMKRSYLDYAMSVIVSRALPDVRDGLKPVHRRILYHMKDRGYTSQKPFKKSARIVGEVMGRFHPHGDAAIYATLVRLAQDFSMRLPLITGQGNFGSIDNDPPAAMRYTEARLAKSAETMLEDIEFDTVPFRPNYDESEQEPEIIPTRIPNLLINGTEGIAVGMATSIPPHNLGEVINGLLALIDDPEIDIASLMKFIPGPDLPTGGIILNREGIAQAYRTGRGSFMMRGCIEVEQVSSSRQALIITEIPYQLSKSRLIDRIGECARDKIIEGISDIRDLSSREGLRIVIELKRGADHGTITHQLYKHTPLQMSFNIILLAIFQKQPKVMNVKEVLQHFIDFREEVVTRRLTFELRKKQERAHDIIGFLVALLNIDRVIHLIRSSPDTPSARLALKAEDWPVGDLVSTITSLEERAQTGTYHLSDQQVKVILELPLQRLTALERTKFETESKELAKRIAEIFALLSSRSKRLDLIRQELRDVSKRHATPRRSEIRDSDLKQSMEDLIQPEEVVVVITRNSLIKRMPVTTYSAQHRGGKGMTGMITRADDTILQIIIANTHDTLFFFTNDGLVLTSRVYALPEGARRSKGRSLHNVLRLSQNQRVTAILNKETNDKNDGYLIFATSSGFVRRNSFKDFERVNAAGKVAMRLNSDEELVTVALAKEDQDILLTTEGGRCIRFSVKDLRVFSSRASNGVRGIKLGKHDKVVWMSLLNASHPSEDREAYLEGVSLSRRSEEELDDKQKGQLKEWHNEPRFRGMQENEEFILTISEKGFGKITSSYHYRRTGRGGMGMANMIINERLGNVVISMKVDRNADILLSALSGGMIRISLGNVRPLARRTQGVRMFNVAKDDKVVSVACLEKEDPET